MTSSQQFSVAVPIFVKGVTAVRADLTCPHSLPERSHVTRAVEESVLNSR